MAQHAGTVAWFNNLKGYGFLQADGMKDVFCHFSAIEDDGYKSLKQGQAIESGVVLGEKGLQAANVQRPPSTRPSLVKDM